MPESRCRNGAHTALSPRPCLIQESAPPKACPLKQTSLSSRVSVALQAFVFLTSKLPVIVLSSTDSAAPRFFPFSWLLEVRPPFLSRGHESKGLAFLLERCCPSFVSPSTDALVGILAAERNDLPELDMGAGSPDLTVSMSMSNDSTTLWSVESSISVKASSSFSNSRALFWASL